MGLIRAITFFALTLGVTRMAGGTIWLGVTIGSGLLFLSTFYDEEQPNDHLE